MGFNLVPSLLSGKDPEDVLALVATAVAIIVLLPAAPRGLILTSVAFCLYLIAASVVHTFLPEDAPDNAPFLIAS